MIRWESPLSESLRPQSLAPQTRELFQPEAFGKYFLIDKMATGGMAEIFKAKTYSHGGFENLLVIKRILPSISENPDFVEMFIDEAKVTVALQQSNIVRINDFGKIGENYFIAMECVDGKDVRNILRKLARRKEWLAPRFCAFIAHGVARGLHYAHTKTDEQDVPYGIVHRDVSPSNVLVGYGGEVKVADFGIAKAESNAYETRDGMLKGKFEYMSPEQAEGREIDHRSDIFSLGIILYEMMTGRRLFKTDSEIATLKRIREADFVKPSKLKPDIPPALEAICLRALERLAGDRYQTAQEMGDELREFLFPATADALQQDLSNFMQDRFGEEIFQERKRLQQGSAVAQELKERAPGDHWDGQTDSTISPVTQTAVRYVVPWLAGFGVAVLLMFGATMAAMLFLLSDRGTAPTKEGAVATSSLAALDIMVMPEARILLDGELQGTTSSLSIDTLDPGTYTLRLEADGFVPVEETVEVAAGVVVKVMKQLEATPGSQRPSALPVAPSAAPSGTAAAPHLDLRSTPSGATVSVDGRVVGKTPMSYTKVKTGERVDVTMTLSGFDSGRAREFVDPGRNRVHLKLPEVAAPATLNVTMLGGGWANVYIDGKKLPKTAPLRDVVVSPGRHKVRVENAALGLDIIQTHTFVAGAVTTVRAAL